MAMSSNGSDDERRYLTKIARLYYDQQLNQREIGRRLNISVASISRALNRAKETGIVRISIDETGDTFGELEIAMEARWNLAECMVVPSASDGASELSATAMAQKTSELLSRILKSGDTVGVSWGKTLKNVGERLEPIGRSGITVIPIIGAMGTVETGIYPNSIAREFAEKVNGTAYLVNTPAVVDTEEIRRSLQRDSAFLSVRRIWDTLDTVLLSVSGLDEKTSAYESGVFSSDDLAEMRRRGGVCATNFSVLDEAGTHLDLPISRRITNVPFSDLKNVAEVVVIAGGTQKTGPLRAALKSGIVTKLITDEESARILTEQP
jgi:DNA-binding transcriptional regulator LsrR (DeoR family)